MLRHKFCRPFQSLPVHQVKCQAPLLISLCFGWAPKSLAGVSVQREPLREVLLGNGGLAGGFQAMRQLTTKQIWRSCRQEILLPVYTTTKEACQKHSDAITRGPCESELGLFGSSCFRCVSLCMIRAVCLLPLGSSTLPRSGQFTRRPWPLA